MTVYRIAAALAAIAVSSGQAFAAPNTGTCVTKAEVRAGLAFLLPTLLSGLKTKCVPNLPASSYLAVRGNDLEARFKGTASQNPEALRSVMLKVLADKDNTMALPGAQDLMAAAFVQKMQADIKPSVCPKVDAALAQLDPLPSENMIGLLEVAVSAMIADQGSKRGKAPQPALCADVGGAK
jgi:hypothetical protein